MLHIQLSIVSDSLTGKASKGSKIKKFEKQLANEGIAILKYVFIFCVQLNNSILYRY